MCENQKIPEKGDTVKIIPMDGHVFNDKTGVILSTDLVTYVAEIKMDNPFPKEKAEIQVHMSKLELLE